MPETLSIDKLVYVLRGFAQAYPEDVFTPLSKVEKALLGPIVVSRCSAAMGRHVAPYMVQAADALEELTAAIERSGLDVSPCRICGETVVCLPDGLPACEACGQGEE